MMLHNLFRYAVIGVGLWSALAAPLMAAPAQNTAKPVKYQFFRDHDRSSLLNVHLVEVNLAHPQITVGLALANGSSNSKEQVTNMAERYNALAAINGSFFHGNKTASAVGLLMKSGQILADSGHRRTSMGITSDNEIIFGIPQVTPGLYFRKANRFQTVNGVNQGRKNNQTIVYTPYFGRKTRTNNWGRDVIVRHNKVVGYTMGNAAIPRDGFVISVHGKNRDVPKIYPKGTSIYLRARKYGPWANVHTLITGAPHLVREGQIYNTYFQENLHPSLKRPNSRSAVGLTHNNKLLMMTVFPSKGNGGVTYTRLAQIMQRLGAVEAMGLDGGSSTSLYVSEKSIHYARRSVTNALIVTMKKMPKKQ